MSGPLTGTLGNTLTEVPGESMHAVAFSPNGTTLAVGEHSNSTAPWRISRLSS